MKQRCASGPEQHVYKRLNRRARNETSRVGWCATVRVVWAQQRTWARACASACCVRTAHRERRRRRARRLRCRRSSRRWSCPPACRASSGWSTRAAGSSASAGLHTHMHMHILYLWRRTVRTRRDVRDIRWHARTSGFRSKCHNRVTRKLSRRGREGRSSEEKKKGKERGGGTLRWRRLLLALPNRQRDRVVQNERPDEAEDQLHLAVHQVAAICSPTHEKRMNTRWVHSNSRTKHNTIMKRKKLKKCTTVTSKGEEMFSLNKSKRVN